MIQVIGSVVVVACVLGGFILEGGKILALWHPTEVLIIVGAAFGAFLTSNPPKIAKAAFQQALALPKGPRYKREDYVTLLKLIYEILMKIRKEGLLAIEQDLEKPEESALFQKYPVVLGDHHMVVFITDCLRLMVGGSLDPHELESLLEYELETHHKEVHEPAHAVQKVADALPGFGIVAAVTATIGHKVGAALVGTFLGILVSYGFIGPIASAMEAKSNEEAKAFEVVKMALVASVRGYAPSVAVEFARKLLFSEVRPTFADLEDELKGRKSA
jgi:chemotaxis protein MotA